jgi:hypothetical protein
MRYTVDQSRKISNPYPISHEWAVWNFEEGSRTSSSQDYTSDLLESEDGYPHWNLFPRPERSICWNENVSWVSWLRNGLNIWSVGHVLAHVITPIVNSISKAKLITWWGRMAYIGSSNINSEFTETSLNINSYVESGFNYLSRVIQVIILVVS